METAVKASQSLETGIDIQIACSNNNIPAKTKFIAWIACCLPENKLNNEISLRLVNKAEMHSLNLQYRGKDKPTNVLSFCCDLAQEVEPPLLGDIVICADIVEEEARQFGKTLEDHWAHLTVHGTLHLLGHDHMEDQEAEIMENLEKKILVGLGYQTPYTHATQGK